ncbi:glycoside hydrolase family 3 C-terminal domain-containing protein [Novosphingobium sp. PY1]|uniref:glycoside hydrolase family 3 C-terminal domain-containing protein n=1 Tax=Novosphingobium sp. PY1 TaxID=1882221 RepID=UPI001A8CF1BD|nr:glycoside hydrolase family 3 C-terminal domain-containing protein [Novosphingobium sp. PY1]GFM31552.1 beta-glucosidase [Novosphingobium sp. PY1]
MREPTTAEKASLTSGAAMWRTAAVPEAGIPSFTMSDGPMGIASGKVDERDIAALSPCAMSLGASWDVDLARRIGALVGGEAVDRGIDAVLAPNINLARSPLAGRAFEYFSEDPFLAGVLGAAWIGGLQSTGTGSIAKHLVCNDSETERDRVDVHVDERTMREVYLLPFEMAAQAGCAGMLAAYNKVNGSWCSEQHHVLTTIVKDEWRYQGVIMSDWFGTHSTLGTINAGLDLEMPGPARFMGAHVGEAVQAGQVSLERLDDAARRVAETARRVTGPKSMPYTAEQVRDLLIEASAAGFVLLKNEGKMLPLEPGAVDRLAIIGPNAAAPCFQGGTFAKISVSPDLATPAQAIAALYEGATQVVFEPGVDPQPRLPSMPARPAQDIGDGCTAGMTLEYFASTDCSGEPLTQETRNTNSIVWFVGVHEQGPFDQGGSVRASGYFTPQKDGAHAFYLGATGEARLFVDGEPVLATSEIEAKDVMGKLKSGDATSASVELAAGREVHVVIEFHYRPARVQGLWYGVRGPDGREELLARAEAAAAEADAVFLFVGETSDSSVESKDRADTLLVSDQLELIERVLAANPRTAIIANVGHAFDTSWDENAAALISAWYPGEGFAQAIAEVLSGQREPGGRMPVTIAGAESDYSGMNLVPDADGVLEYAEGTRFGYRAIACSGARARHAFGSGEGYARFAWSDARVEGDSVAVTLRNISDRAGSEVVQVYRDEPEPTLVAFAKCEIAPGSERRVVLPLRRRQFVMWQGSGWEPLGDRVALRVARSVEDPGIAVSVDWEALVTE